MGYVKYARGGFCEVVKYFRRVGIPTSFEKVCRVIYFILFIL